jgi:hypothetical protein
MSIIKNIFTNKSTLTFVVGGLFVLLFLRQCNQTENLKHDLEIAKNDSNRNFNNYLASKDSIRVIQAENGNLISEIRSYEFDLSNLKDDQSNLLGKYKKALNINKDLNKVNTLLSTDIDIKDSLIANTTASEVDSTTTRLTFVKFDDFGSGNTRNLNGSMFITKMDSGFNYGNATFDIDHTINLLAAIENVEGANQLKISTSYPGLSFGSIENINLINTKLNQKPKKKGGWSLGVGIGYGINLNNNQVISTGPSIGLGLYYSPKWLRF